MTAELTRVQELKFELLAEGLEVSDAVVERTREIRGDRPLTPADYATTSGVILEIDGSVWVNAPVAQHNPNFVSETRFRLVVDDDALAVEGPDGRWPAALWLPPKYHGEFDAAGAPWNSYGFTHGDRVRVSPVEGCSMTCQFCDLPYEFRYRTKEVAGLVAAVRTALHDQWQPAAHVLVSGGTPRSSDIGYVRECYEQIVLGADGAPVDVMMVPLDDLMDPRWLDAAGIHQISVNLEVFGRERARELMRKKAAQGLDHYLDYLASAAEVMGPGRVRSMLLVGLEPLEDTLTGVRAIAERGCVPVLSPFRPDPSTPLATWPPPTPDLLREVYLRCAEIAAEAGVSLGPDCAPCTHNTLTFAGETAFAHGRPALV